MDRWIQLGAAPVSDPSLGHLFPILDILLILGSFFAGQPKGDKAFGWPSVCPIARPIVHLFRLRLYVRQDG